MKFGLLVCALAFCSLAATAAWGQNVPRGAISVEEARQRLEERQRQRRERPEAATPVGAATPKPKPTVKALALKDGAPEAVHEWFARLPVIQAARVIALESEVRAFEAQIRDVEKQPLPRVKVGGGAFGTSEYRPDEAAGRARSQRVKEMRQQLRGMKQRVERARQDRTFIDIPPLTLEAGGFGFVESARVSEIIDGHNMLAGVAGKEVWLTGVPTQGLVDGATVPLDRTMVVSRTRKVQGYRTVFVLEPLDLKEWVTVIDQDPGEAPPAEQVAAQQIAARRVKPVAGPDAAEAVAVAIREGRLVREMTPEDAVKALGAKPQRQTDTDRGVRMVWELRGGTAAQRTPQAAAGAAQAGRPGFVFRRVTAWFEDGRLTHFEDEKNR